MDADEKRSRRPVFAGFEHFVGRRERRNLNVFADREARRVRKRENRGLNASGGPHTYERRELTGYVDRSVISSRQRHAAGVNGRKHLQQYLRNFRRYAVALNLVIECRILHASERIERVLRRSCLSQRDLLNRHHSGNATGRSFRTRVLARKAYYPFHVETRASIRLIRRRTLNENLSMVRMSELYGPFRNPYDDRHESKIGRTLTHVPMKTDPIAPEGFVIPET